MDAAAYEFVDAEFGNDRVFPFIQHVSRKRGSIMDVLLGFLLYDDVLRRQRHQSQAIAHGGFD